VLCFRLPRCVLPCFCFLSFPLCSLDCLECIWSLVSLCVLVMKVLGFERVLGMIWDSGHFLIGEILVGSHSPPSHRLLDPSCY
jgi:hypothetical protein